ncbi:hypothetical protein J2S17_005425 [Cytobacillus purgationiresistens]|uniref:Helicase HerA central domain-containing protein n=1 Tax=Cytobacillus purgationiresistens TaxID=863449 RepID=A0ABU0AQE2_9BACI|nr:DUF87 domain-containing protein [Cytobacillus purgationiresistens]MDQ0273493.1 hypothetical protein [Cytobacillus purgationiresistens]
MLKKKLKKKRQVEEVIETPINEDDLAINMIPTLWDVISPDGIKITSDDYGIVKQSLSSKTYFRPFYIPRDGYPRKMQTDWLSALTSSGEIDIMIDVHNIPKNDAIRMLQKQNTILKSNLSFQIKRGNQDQVLDLQTKIVDTEVLMEELQFSENDAYHVGVLGNLYANSERELDKYFEKIEDEMGSKFIKLASTWGRVKKGIRSITPLASNEIKDSLRNIDRRSLATFAPFISGSGKFNGGIPIGRNLITGQKEFYNAFGTPENKPDNYNMAIFGVSGSGKSIAVKLLLARETTGLSVSTRIIDVEGENKRIVKRLGGISLGLSEESKIIINPLALNVTNIPLEDNDEELEFLEDSDQREVFEKDGKTYISFVPIKEKINEALDFFDILCRGKNQEGEGLTVFESNYCEEALNHQYKKLGYTTHPSSLFEEKPKEVNGQIVQSKVRKPEPTISDVYNYLVSNYSNEYNAERLIAAIRPFLRDGSKPIFDGQTYLGKSVTGDLHTAKLVNFDISQMEEGFLRPIAYHVILNYIWEYFVKNVDNALKRKIVLCDEFWTMIDSEQTVTFAEKVARRIRKRNGGFRIASQDFVRILESKKARGVLQNTHTFFFLKQNKIDLKLINENFDLSQGEISKLFENPDKGEGIFRVGRSSVWLQTDPSTEELEFIESNDAVLAERRQKNAFTQQMLY